MVRAGGKFHLPSRGKPETPDEVQARKARVEKDHEAKKKQKERIAEQDERHTKIAKDLYELGGGDSKDDSLYSRNRRKGIKEELDIIGNAGRQGAQYLKKGILLLFLSTQGRCPQEG